MDAAGLWPVLHQPQPIDTEPLCEFAKSTPEDVEKALDAAHAAKDHWGRTSPAERAAILLRVADPDAGQP